MKILKIGKSEKIQPNLYDIPSRNLDINAFNDITAISLKLSNYAFYLFNNHIKEDGIIEVIGMTYDVIDFSSLIEADGVSVTIIAKMFYTDLMAA